ncbi:bifunctional folylpolyglutamate synthase/dihydrofolate synthase [Mumia sp. zg.B53]|uniref:bifunctional folylpolyglutamate synthase/dihydrofolate synthase n=1 Tax=unclassified Mumia TaxID=2621872 RepID=UPI001C6DDC10|nr:MULTISPECIES: folylpolyglutamate synthase/dihydrofolate synthase family protein [unclassified Mumia]MBW9206539.1 bifunctional folylpolyglutamate synthase/dihydrofolate synthase [Mumia sp. zg.B17]MBW9211172.1 bifunctional folylpolyglutamate synthase/dihydrofolate synthase [Mumia sp. zg.B21]MBW9215746.1 bifunctional folylpolyglutamate synthase/dihydrofolate synthase [Mumia sp. zg.B53]
MTNPTYADVEQALLARWPETRLEPSLERIRALCRLMGDPQTAYPVIQLTGTNGKTSTGRMIDALLRELGVRTGRFTSPHLVSMTERISIDGQPLSEELFVEAYADVAAYAQVVDDSQPVPLSYFELMVGIAYQAFADAPVDVAVVEVGMGGTWDATNVVDAAVAVITPIDVDHASYLGDTPGDIAVEKSGIIKPGAQVVVARQPEDAAAEIAARATEVGATLHREGVEFGVIDRTPALGGQLLTLKGIGGTYPEVFLPLFGSHQADNAAYALAAVEAFTGSKELDGTIVRDAFAAVTSPGRLEVVRRSPTVVLDAAHNPAGARATAEAVQEAFSFTPLIGVVGVMADKEVDEILQALEPVMAEIVCTQNATDRAMPADELADVAEGIFGSDRVHVARRLPDAIEKAVALAESERYGEGVGSGGVLVTGSVVTVGEARVLLAPRETVD